jgi:hypothetical protein
MVNPMGVRCSRTPARLKRPSRPGRQGRDGGLDDLPGADDRRCRCRMAVHSISRHSNIDDPPLSDVRFV